MHEGGRYQAFDSIALCCVLHESGSKRNGNIHANLRRAIEYSLAIAQNIAQVPRCEWIFTFTLAHTQSLSMTAKLASLDQRVIICLLRSRRSVDLTPGKMIDVNVSQKSCPQEMEHFQINGSFIQFTTSRPVRSSRDRRPPSLSCHH